MGFLKVQLKKSSDEEFPRGIVISSVVFQRNSFGGEIF